MNYVGIVCLWSAMAAPRLPLELVTGLATAAQSRPDGELTWHTDYATATAIARLEKRSLFIHFTADTSDRAHQQFLSNTLADAEVRHLLQRFVLARLPLHEKITSKGRQIILAEHAAFAEMHGRPGLAILDFEHRDAALYGHVVSAFPFSPGHYYRADAMRVVLDLPVGTLTQRTMVFAVRMHPESPASARGQWHPVLTSEAGSHAAHQAAIGVQGHQQWESRFHRINHRVGEGAVSSEVCAESWPGETLVEACHECVRSWRQSPGHWQAVRSRQALFGYDIRRGRNGIWYATGLFANFGR